MAPTPSTPPHAAVLAGVPRSGSTWVAEVLTARDDVTLVHEPDNDQLNLGALAAKRGLTTFPSLARDERRPALEQLWRDAVAGRYDRTTTNLKAQRAITKQVSKPVRDRWLATGDGPAWLRVLAHWPRPAGAPADTPHVLVKTVHAVRHLDWLVGLDLARVAVVRRDGADVVSSWQRLGWHGQPWAPKVLAEVGCGDLVGDHFAELAVSALWQVREVDRAAARLDLVVVDYRAASLDPHAVLADAAEQLGLPWGDANRAAIDARERAGTGYATNRERGAGLGVAAQRLDDDQRTTLDRLVAALDRLA